jgi:hypothetical protein
MPLPLTDLDTRRWSDLVEEGRGLIPRYAPGWTDHNVHDPGITMIELLAWLVDHDIYRVNRIPERHYRKFLLLAGFGPEPPKPARVPIEFRLVNGNAVQHLPAGLALTSTTPGRPPMPFRTLAPITVVQTQIVVMRAFDGRERFDQTRQWRERLQIYLFGPDPVLEETSDTEKQPAFYIGFDRTLPADTPISLWLQFSLPGVDWDARDQLIVNARDEAAACAPVRPRATCPPADPGDDIWCPPEQPVVGVDEPEDENCLPPHHSVVLVWDYYGARGWTPLDPGLDQVCDETRGLTLDGQVIVRIPDAMEPTTLNSEDEPHFYLRCRLQNGQPDQAPVAYLISINTVPVEQSRLVQSTFAIRPDAVLPPAGTIVAGKPARLLLWFDRDGSIERIEASSDDDLPEVFVIAFHSVPGLKGQLVTTATRLGESTGLPEQTFSLPAASVTNGVIDVWTQQDDRILRWDQRLDLDASGRDSAHFALDSTTGRVGFGNGERGRVPPVGSNIMASYWATAGRAGNVPAGAGWQLDSSAAVLNQQILGVSPNTVAARISAIRNVLPATSGADEEDIRNAAGRTAEMLWAHERLLELCPPGQCETLDSLEPLLIRSREAPPRAVTLLDFERLALAVPGTYIRRARAWANLDPNLPCVEASGTVTVVIVPGLPAARPKPTQELIDTVTRFLDRRRTIGTRLVVAAPEYIEVRVRATVRIKTGASEERALQDIVQALNRFLDPLSGGPSGRGWPFGRAVYRSEVLQAIDSAPGVDHMRSLELSGSPGSEQCGSVCVPPTWLVTPGRHEIEVVR